MQVILMEKVVNLGNLGDVVNVKPGYARNYLIPQNKAKRVTPENLAVFEQKRAELEKAQNDKLEAAQSLAARLQDVKVEIARKAGVDGRLFGSVSNFDIAEVLNGMGIEITKAAIVMPLGPLKQVGQTQVDVILHTDVQTQVTVVITGEL